MDYTKPLVIQFQNGRGKQNDGQVHQSGDVLTVPNKLNQWSDFDNALKQNFQSGNYDSTIVSFMGAKEDLQNDYQMNSLNIKNNTVKKEANEAGLPMFNRYKDQMYFINPTYSQRKNDGKDYAPKDDEIMAKHDSYGSQDAWQKHQADILKRFKATMPLTTGKPWEHSNHTADLKQPKRGLHDEDLKDFFSWKSNQPVTPELMGDDMVGMPSIKAKAFKDTSVSYHGKKIDSTPVSLQTGGLEGYMIPMRNQNGDSFKYQIGADVSPINMVLKARASDGTSIAKDEYLDKKGNGGKGVYNFNIDGQPSKLTVDKADNDSITMKDIKGPFNVNLKENIKPQLEERGYDIPDIIDNIKPEPNSKYIWMSKGSMVGSKKINDTEHPERDNNKISPSSAGFITARPPKNGSDEYVVMVAEGALKGTIASKYMDVKDKEGQSVGDKIAGDKGIIVAQVPGVAEAFVRSVDRVYDKLPEGKIAGTYIAMDADGRDNLRVAEGIHGAYDELKKHNDGKVKIMSWDPKQKGIDDSLLAIAQGKINVDDMDIHFGNPDQLFPLDKAKAPNPYKLDGTKTNGNKPTWMKEYADDAKRTNDKILEAQNTNLKANPTPQNNGQNNATSQNSGQRNPSPQQNTYNDEPPLPPEPDDNFDFGDSLNDLSNERNNGMQQ